MSKSASINTPGLVYVATRSSDGKEHTMRVYLYDLGDAQPVGYPERLSKEQLPKRGPEAKPDRR